MTDPSGSLGDEAERMSDLDAIARTAAILGAILDAVNGRKAAEHFIALKAYLDAFSAEVREALAAQTREQKPVWNRWAPDALESPLAPAHLVEAYNRWQPDHLKIHRERS